LKRNFVSGVTIGILLLAFACLVVSCGTDKTTTTATSTEFAATAAVTEPPLTSSTQPVTTTSSNVPDPVFPPLGMGDTDKMPRFLWSDVAGAVSYEFQLSKETAFAAPIINTPVSTTQYYYTDEPLEYSLQYYWRVRSIDSSGTPGAWCETQSFTVCPDC